MKNVFRLLAECLLLCLILPQLAQAGGDQGKAPYEIGEKLFARKDYRTALTYYRKALELNDVRAHYRMGLIYEHSGKDRDALGHYRRYLELGRTDAQSSDTAGRVGAIEKRLQRKTALPPDLLAQGKSLFLKGKYREAETVLLEAASRNTAKPETHFYLGEVYMGLEEYGKAAAEYRKAKKLY
ncbi:MAG: tetratricopeptide repeat protein [Candidatus Methylomirabilia bacterium]